MYPLTVPYMRTNEMTLSCVIIECHNQFDNIDTISQIFPFCQWELGTLN